MRQWHGVSLAAVLVLVLCAVSQGDAGEPRPELTLKASPQIAFTPARVVLTGELRNVAGSQEELYCPAVEWEWGDGTRSESSSDCAPFVAGTSEVRTRFIQSHTFNTPGRFKIFLRLRRGTRTLIAGSTTVTIRPGGGYLGDYER